jgi:UDP-N-acetylmuramoyl-L-alanyl-D-glutamate--2,6-diaminopimelate ligase
MLATIFEANHWSTGIIGTLHGPRTTPEAPELQATLAGFVDDGRDAAVLEVSSHALALHRVDGTRFDAVVFTNLGHDHLDLHGTREEYFRAKASLFRSEFAPLAVVNHDDTHGQLLIDVITSGGDDIAVIPFSVSDLDDVRVSATSIEYRWRGQDVLVAIGGDFNVSNSLAALETAVALGVDPATAASALRQLPVIPGRFENVVGFDTPSVPFSVVVDYAHTPDGIVEVLGAARRVVGDDAAVIIVFGCGGDRDHAKRAAMGAAAAAGADRVFITSDNPRSEHPMSIINDINEGVGDHYRDRVTSEPDRRRAIGAAIEAARPGDIIVIAGKGHEQTQDLGGNVVAFDDRAVARSFLDTETPETASMETQ